MVVIIKIMDGAKLISIMIAYMSFAKTLPLMKYGSRCVDMEESIMRKMTKEEKDKYLSIVLVLSCVCFLSMLFLLIEINKYNKIKNEN